MSDNTRRLREILLKHLEQENSEVKQLEALILAAKQNRAADTIKSAAKFQRNDFFVLKVWICYVCIVWKHCIKVRLTRNVACVEEYILGFSNVEITTTFNIPTTQIYFFR